MKIDLRDYFAAQAMAIAIREWEELEGGNIPFVCKDGYPCEREGEITTWFPHTKHFADSCYAIADEMMEARKK